MVAGSGTPANMVSELSQLGPVTVNGSCGRSAWPSTDVHSGYSQPLAVCSVSIMPL